MNTKMQMYIFSYRYPDRSLINKSGIKIIIFVELIF